MTERPKPPRRPEAYWPTAPPLPGAFSEPFPKAKSDPPPLPASALSETPAPCARRMRSTPPSGSLLPRGEVDQVCEDPRDQVIRDLRLINDLYREKLTLATLSSTDPSAVPEAPPSEAPKSRARVAGAVVGTVGFHLGKYTTYVVGVLGIADVVVGLWWPEYKGPLGQMKSLLGIP